MEPLGRATARSEFWVQQGLGSDPPKLQDLRGFGLKQDTIPTVTLRNGVKMPILAAGNCRFDIAREG